jgi:hypothetical protein
MEAPWWFYLRLHFMALAIASQDKKYITTTPSRAKEILPISSAISNSNLRVSIIRMLIFGL